MIHLVMSFVELFSECNFVVHNRVSHALVCNIFYSKLSEFLANKKEELDKLAYFIVKFAR